MAPIATKKVLSLIFFRGFGVVLQILMQFAVARVAGAAGLGLVQICQTWTCVLGEASAMGLPTQTMKTVSRSAADQQIINRLISSVIKIGTVWLVLFLTGLLGIWLGVFTLHMGLYGSVAWSVLCFAILRISAEALKALDQAEFAIFTENSIVPGLIVLVCFAVWLGLLGVQGHIEGTYLIYASAFFLTAAAGISCGRLISLCKTSLTANEPFRKTKVFSRETPFFWGTAILAIGFLNLPFLVMPYFGSVDEIGLFALAFKLMNPITTVLIMLGAVFAPSFAQCANRPDSLKRLLMQSQAISVLIYLPILVVILVFSEPILLVFGPEFLAAKPYLYVLAIAQLVNACTGLSANLLNMVGMGSREFQGGLCCSLFGLVACIWAGHQYGLIGIAIAYSLALAVKNLWSYGFALAAIYARDMRASGVLLSV